MTLEQVPVADASAVLAAVPARPAAMVLRNMTVLVAAECLAHLATEDTAAIAAELSADDIAPVARAMEPAQRDALLAALPQETREPLARVLSYPEGTAGAVMDPSIFQLPDDVLVADARTRLMRAARDLLYYIYIVDREQHLVGVLDVPELMIARARDPLSAAMHRDVSRVNVWLPVAQVREHPGWQSFHALPVVDEQDRLLGAVRYQTLRRLEREASGRGPGPGQVTAGALAELFQLGTTGFVAGLAATSSGEDPSRPLVSDGEAPDAG